MVDAVTAAWSLVGLVVVGVLIWYLIERSTEARRPGRLRPRVRRKDR